MSNVSFKFTNKDKLFKSLTGTVPAINVNLRKALEQGGDEMVEKARSFVAVDEGDARDSISWDFTKKTKANKTASPAIIIQAGAEKLGDDAFYVRWLEFGRVGVSARPFFFPAYRLLKRKIKGRLTRAMSKAIKQAGFGAK